MAQFDSREPANGQRSGPVLRRPTLGSVVAVACWLYCAAILTLWLLLATAGVGAWPVTLFAYGPRWVAALPLVALVPAAAAARWRLLGLLGLAGAVLAVPVMGFCVPWRTVFRGGQRGPILRVMTCNIQGSSGDPVALGRLIVREKPDLVVLEECAADIKSKVFWQGVWEFGHSHNVALGSRHQIVGVHPIRGRQVRDGAVVCFQVVLPDQRSVNVFGVHLATPRDGMQEAVYFSRTAPEALRETVSNQWFESDAARPWMRQFPGPSLALGDFNLPVESVVYRTYWSDWANAFSEVGLGFGPTKFTRWFGVRIDHILHGPQWRARRSWVGPDIGSDHRPVFAELEWIGDDP